MRIIAGRAGGIRLDVPKRQVRPTMDRVKAAIFSSLGERVMDAHVLDLFAGTGALGIEALSRGASSARFVDHDREAVATIERNLTKTKFDGCVLKRDVFDFLRRPVSTQLFNIIFADPPYEKTKDERSFTDLLLKSDDLVRLIEPSGTFVLEKRPAEEICATELWHVVRAKTYGATEVLFLNRSE
jgi:16S rRNA (guanine966-N2)-methyltransferase